MILSTMLLMVNEFRQVTDVFNVDLEILNDFRKDLKTGNINVLKINVLDLRKARMKLEYVQKYHEKQMILSRRSVTNYASILLMLNASWFFMQCFATESF